MVLAAPRTDPQLDILVSAIVERIQPELILLFGSRARGDAHEGSDYDIMLVVRDDADVERANKAVLAMRERVPIHADVITCTVSEYERRQHDPGFLQWLISREGRLLYSHGTIPQRSARVDRVRETPTEGRDLWIGRAESDFQAAINSVSATKPSWDAVCFHAHACIEKLLKALIAAHGAFPPRTHSLEDLMAELPAGIRDDSQLIASTKVLDGLYPKSRYVDKPMPTPEEARKGFEAARVARARLRAALTP